MSELMRLDLFLLVHATVGVATAVHALQQPFGGELAQIAANGVFRQRELLAERLRDNAAVALQDREDVLFALAGKHRAIVSGQAADCTDFLVYARIYA